MSSSRREIYKEGFIRRERFLVTHPFDCLVGHVRHEMVPRVGGRFNFIQTIIDRWRPLVHLTRHKAIELVETGASRPPVCGTGRTDLPDSSFVILAELGSGVAIVP